MRHYLVTMIVSSLLAVVSLPYSALWGFFTIGMMLLAVVSLLSLVISIGYPPMESPPLETPSHIHPDRVLEARNNGKKDLINVIIMVLIMIPLSFTSLFVIVLFVGVLTSETLTMGFIFCISLAILLIWSQGVQKTT